MTHDVANCSAAGIISHVKTQALTMGKYSLSPLSTLPQLTPFTGVLTKPDCVQPGESLKQWTSLIENKGYHVVMNSPDTQMDHATARIKEKAFFRDVEPYATELRHFHNRFGTLQLQSALSAKLTTQILKR